MAPPPHQHLLLSTLLLAAPRSASASVASVASAAPEAFYWSLKSATNAHGSVLNYEERALALAFQGIVNVDGDPPTLFMDAVSFNSLAAAACVASAAATRCAAAAAAGAVDVAALALAAVDFVGGGSTYDGVQSSRLRLVAISARYRASSGCSQLVVLLAEW